MSLLTDRLAQAQRLQTMEAKINEIKARGNITDTGAKYSAQQAVADSSNADLRMTATIVNGSLVWSK